MFTKHLVVFFTHEEHRQRPWFFHRRYRHGRCFWFGNLYVGLWR